MADSSISVTPGNGNKKLGTYSASVGGTTVEFQRVALTDSGGTEISFPPYCFNVLAQATGGSATRTSSDLVAPKETTGVLLHLKLANRAGTIQVTPSVQWKTCSSNYLTLWTAASAATANGDYIYYLGNLGGGTMSGSVTEAKSMPFPQGWRAVLTLAGTTSVDTLLDGSYLA